MTNCTKTNGHLKCFTGLFLSSSSCVPTTNIKKCHIFRQSDRCISLQVTAPKGKPCRWPHGTITVAIGWVVPEPPGPKWAVPLNCTCRGAKVQSQATEGATWASCNCDKSHVNLHCVHGLFTFKNLFSIYCLSQETQWPSENEWSLSYFSCMSIFEEVLP